MNTQGKQLCICVVGTGSIGQRHLNNLVKLGCQNIIAVSEYHKRKEITVGDRQISTSNSYGEALLVADVVVIANPSSMHFEYLKQAIEKNKHIYLEKPIALEKTRIPTLIDRAENAELVIATGTQFRFNPRLLELKELISRGSLGRLLSVTASSGEHVADYHPKEDYHKSYAAKSELGGGVLLTQIHQIDYLNWLFGKFEHAYAAEVEVPELNIDVEACVTYVLSRNDGLTVAGHLNYLQRPKATNLQVIGTLATAEWSYENNSLTIVKNCGEITTTTTVFDRNQMFLECMRNFIECLGTGKYPRASLRDGYEALAIVNAIKTSMKIHDLTRIDI